MSLTVEEFAEKAKRLSRALRGAKTDGPLASWVQHQTKYFCKKAAAQQGVLDEMRKLPQRLVQARTKTP